jgi:hypothetical protein
VDAGLAGKAFRQIGVGHQQCPKDARHVEAAGVLAGGFRHAVRKLEPPPVLGCDQSFDVPEQGIGDDQFCRQRLNENMRASLSGEREAVTDGRRWTFVLLGQGDHDILDVLHRHWALSGSSDFSLGPWHQDHPAALIKISADALSLTCVGGYEGHAACG